VPTRPTGVYPDSSGGWYYKARLPKDPITGRHEQITRRGFRTAVEAGKARRELIGKVDKGELRSAPTGITVSDLLDLYLDGLDADQRLSEKTRYDYRHSTEDYVRPHLGNLRLRDVTPDAILAEEERGRQAASRQGPLAEHGAACSVSTSRRLQIGHELRHDHDQPGSSNSSASSHTLDSKALEP
jgi:hypothetical protein